MWPRLTGGAAAIASLSEKRGIRKCVYGEAYELICFIEDLFIGGEGIKIKEAITERFRQICAERGISYTELARLAGITPSTVYSMLQLERKDVSAVTVKKLCDGLDLCITEFYDCDLFRNLPPEIE